MKTTILKTRIKGIIYILLAFFPSLNASTNYGEDGNTSRGKSLCYEFVLGGAQVNYNISWQRNIIDPNLNNDSVIEFRISSPYGLIFGIQKNVSINYSSIIRLGLIANYFPKAFESSMLKKYQTTRGLALDLPLHFVYSFNTLTKRSVEGTYPYLIIGGKYTYTSTVETSPILFNSNDLSVDIGIGTRIYILSKSRTMRKYLMGAELKYSFGLLDLDHRKNNGSIIKNFRNSITLTISIS